MTKIDFETEKIKEIVNKLISQGTEKISSIFDIAKFIWNVVNEFIDTLTDKNLNLQQKEDIAVGIATCVVSELETKEFITKELADKTRGVIESTDVFLDILLEIYKVVFVKQVTKSIFKFFGFSCCDTVKVEIPQSRKVEVIETLEELKPVEIQGIKIIEGKEEIPSS